MKFKIQVGDFSQKLGLVQGISERRATMPVLSHVLITLKNNKIEISTKDLETNMSTWCVAEFLIEGSLAITAKKLYEIINEL